MPLKVNRTFKGETFSTGDDKKEVWMYNVQADNLTFTVNQAKTAVDGVTSSHAIPSKGSTHPEDTTMYCSNIAAARDADCATLFRVTLTWKSPSNNGDSPPAGTTVVYNVDLAFDREAYSELRNIDLDGLPLVNVVCTPIDRVECKGTDPVTSTPTT